MINRRQFVGSLVVVSGAVVVVRSRVWGQPSSTSVVQSKSGIVVAVDRDRVYVNSSSGPLTVKTKPSTRIWKGEFGVNVDAIRPGDDLAMRGVIDVDGSFVPSEIWVNITILDGVVKSVSGNVVVVDVIRNDSVSQTRSVKLSDKTLSSQDVPLRKEQVQVGRVVQVIGLALEDGTIQATRVRVYVNGRLIDSTGSKHVNPVTGRVIDKP